MRLVADTEADDLLETATVIHCLCMTDLDTEETLRFADHPGYHPLKDGLALLDKADWIIGHSFKHYDAPLIARLKGVVIPDEKILDTLDLCKALIDLDELSKLDYELHARGEMPLHCVRRLSLKSWGYRLGHRKHEFGETADWKTFSPAMVEYCAIDTQVNAALYRMFEGMLV